MAILRRTDTPIIEVSHPTNEHEFLTDYDSNMMSLWFNGDCMPNVLIDNDDLSDSEKTYNEYEEDFVINANIITYATALMAKINFQKCMLQYSFFFHH